MEYKDYSREIDLKRKEHGFTGIFISLEMLEFDNGSLSPTELLILAEIQNLCRIGKYHKCIANNQHFSKLIGVSDRTVERAISHLYLLNAIELNISHNSTNGGKLRTIKFNSEMFKPDYSEIDYIYEDDQATNCQSQATNCQSQATNCQSQATNCQKSSFIEENKEENKEETPDQPVSAKISKHDLLYRETESLRDDLESGKDIDVQKKERKKLSEYDKCVAEIDNSEYNFSTEVKQLLKEHLQMSFYSKDPKRIKSKGNYVQKLRALKQLISKGNDGEKIVQQSIDRQWNAFYEVKEEYVKEQRLEGVKAGNESYTKEEIAEMMKTSKVY